MVVLSDRFPACMLWEEEYRGAIYRHRMYLRSVAEAELLWAVLVQSLSVVTITMHEWGYEGSPRRHYGEGYNGIGR